MTLIFLRSFHKKLLPPSLLFHLDGHQALPVLSFHPSAACPCGYEHYLAALTACPVVAFVSEESCLQEVRSILRARKLGVPTPVLYYVEHETNCIYMEKVEGVSLKAALQNKQLDEQGEYNT